MILRELFLKEGWTTLKQKVAIKGIYEVDLVQNEVGGKSEVFAKIFTGAHRLKKELKVYDGITSEINLDELETKAKKFLEDF